MYSLCRRLALAALPPLLVGCAALQIDVDVYKGPLVNNDEIQRDQLISMALSAKPLLLNLRNRMLDRHAPRWDQPEATDNAALRADCYQRRQRVMSGTEFQQVLARQCVATDADTPAPRIVDPKSLSVLRNARQVNEVLRSYDDRGDAVLLQALAQLGAAERRFVSDLDRLDARRRSLRSPSTLEEDPASTALYRTAWRARVDVWTAMADVGRTVSESRGAERRLDTVNAINRRLAQGLADITDPALLWCALEQSPAPTPGMSALWRSLQEQPNGPRSASELAAGNGTAQTFVEARTALVRALQSQPLTLLDGLEQAHVRMRLDRLPCVQDSPRATGIVRAPRYSSHAGDDDASVDMIGLASQLEQLQSSGFDNGRIVAGLDRLANEYANARDALIQFGPSGIGTAAEHERLRNLSEAALNRLEHALADFASRMQFIATSSWVVEQSTGNEEERGYKAALEVVGNSLLVHADDIRHRSRHQLTQRKALSAERQAANASFASDGLAALGSIERALRAQQAEAQQRAARPAAGPEASLSGVQTRLLQAQEKDAALAAQIEAGNTQWSQMVALGLTLGLARELPERRDLARDSLKDWTADAAELRQALLKTADEAHPERVRQEAESWLSAALAGLENPAQKDSDRARRLRAALNAVQQFKPQATAPARKRAVAWTAWQQLVRAQVAELRGRLLLQRDELTELQILARRLRQQAATLQEQSATPGLPLSSADFDLAMHEVLGARVEVLKQLEALGGRAEESVVRGFLVMALETSARLPDISAARKQPLENAVAALRRLHLAPQRLPGSTAASGSPVPGAEPPKPVDILDELTTALNYRLLRAIADHGAQSNEARKLREAIAQAGKHREGKLYLRSTTAYLRSVYAATSLQTDPELDWNNMLKDRLKQLIDRERTPGRGIRSDVDKANWQNINTVSVSASGSSNFVLAKDDVGNWYVKAMGSDPAAMVRAAKNLALYNIGGRFDTDLLRVDELRERLDTESDPDRRTELRSELNELSGRGGKSQGAASGQALQLFIKHHDDQAEAHRKDLALPTRLSDLEQALKRRWDLSLATSESRQALSTEAFQREAVREGLDRARAAFDSQPASGTANPTAQDALFSALGALLQVNEGLKSAVQEHAALTASEVQDVEKSAKRLETALAALAAAQNALDAAASQLAEADGVLRAARSQPNADKAALAAAEQQFDRTRSDYAAKAVLHRQALQDRGKAEQESSTSRAALEAAQARQRKAMADVDDVYKRHVDDAARLRLRAVEETETALRILGSSGR